MDTQLTPFVGTVDISVKVVETITQICDDHIYGSSSKLERAVWVSEANMADNTWR